MKKFLLSNLVFAFNIALFAVGFVYVFATWWK